MRDILTWFRKDWPHFLASAAGIEMCVKFWQSPTPDYLGLTGAIVGIVGVLAGKHYWDAKTDTVKQGDQ